MVNFDNAATSFPKPVFVRNAVNEAMIKYGGNPGRSGHSLSIKTSEALFSARKKCADFFGAEPQNTVFTQNCTHALNLAIKGYMKQFSKGHIIISSLEHNSVSRPVYVLERSGYIYSVAEVSETKEQTIRNFQSLIRSDTKAIACTAASNVTGQILPYKEIAKLCADHNLCFILDCAQGAGILPIKLDDGINFICTAGHKSLYGPSGTGLLVSDGKYPLIPLFEGGTGSDSLKLEQPEFLPDSLESGTINTAGIIGLGAGIDFINGMTREKIRSAEDRLCRILIDGLKNIDGIIIYRNRNSDYAPIVSFNIKGKTSNETASFLSDKGFALRSGLHCSALAHQSLGTAPDGTVRFAPSVFNNTQQVYNLVKTLKNIK